jgi:ketosteroid isomerase-like protein
MRCSKSVFVTALILCYCWKLEAQQSQAESVVAEAEIRSLELQNASTTDPDLLKNLIADDYAMIGLDGSVSSKAQIVKAGAGESKPKITLNIRQIAYFQGSAVVVGVATVSSKRQDAPTVSVELNYTNVWMKRGGKWRLIASHMSPLHPLSAELCASLGSNGKR